MGVIPAAQQHEALGAAYILSGLRLGIEMISQIIRRDVMQESVTYQAILEEGRQDERRSIALDLLREGLSIELIVKVSHLSIEEVNQLRAENG
jgi:predicted transposase YdaD